MYLFKTCIHQFRKPAITNFLIPILFLFLTSFHSSASTILIPMDAESQENHLKAYGITYWVLTKQQKVQWLLNYRGGSFLLP
ncbi:MAG: asparagine synthetase B, partial [Eudoraea sp.]